MPAEQVGDTLLRHNPLSLVSRTVVNPLSLWCRISDKSSDCRVAREYAKFYVHISGRHIPRLDLQQMGHPFFRRLHLEAALFHYPVAFLLPPFFTFSLKAFSATGQALILKHFREKPGSPLHTRYGERLPGTLP